MFIKKRARARINTGISFNFQQPDIFTVELNTKPG